MFNKKIQVLLGMFAIITAIAYLSCDDGESCSAEQSDAGMYEAQEVCNEDWVCAEDETVMSCPADCWDITKTTTCRAAYNETRMSCLDYTVDTDATDKTPMEIYQYIYDSCIQLGREEQCHMGTDECIVKISQDYSCLAMACVDNVNYHVCMIPPVETENEQIMSLDFGVWTVPYFPADPGWTQGACNVMSGLGMNPPVDNEIVTGDDITCDLY